MKVNMAFFKSCYFLC